MKKVRITGVAWTALVTVALLASMASQAASMPVENGTEPKGDASTMTTADNAVDTANAVPPKGKRYTSDRPRQIVAYTGYGNGEYLWVRGRVLANKTIRAASDDDSWWDNIRASFQRWETDEIEGVWVELSYGDERKFVQTDDEGYYSAQFAVVDAEQSQQNVTARVETRKGDIEAVHEVLVADPAARFMIISDMDDTVIHTGITRKLLAARLTFFGNARTRKPLDGVADLYRELVDGSDGTARNPVFYVSNSGWNMYDVLDEFLELNKIPPGPLLLRDLGNVGKRSTKNHKAQTFRRLLERFPTLPAVLIGDSGQHDAALYAELAREFPDRVLGIYIRDVDPFEDSDYDAAVDAIINDGTASGVPMVRGENSDAFAQHMRSIGLLSPSEERQIAKGVEREQAEDTFWE
ncbi:MAG: DUF2183 domain-containing protein [Woeseia sp.]|nr:DUF2183 domain-containing protein [Woeseia sp.]